MHEHSEALLDGTPESLQRASRRLADGLDATLVERQAADVLPDLHECARRMGAHVSEERLIEAARRIARAELSEAAARGTLPDLLDATG